MAIAFTCAQARAHDAHCMRALGLPGIVLMENAAIGCAQLALRMLPRGQHGRALVLCGPGQNGGDGHAIARHLRNAGCHVQVLELAPPRDGTDAATMRGIAVAMGIPVQAFEPNRPLPPCDLIVDALFGTGLDRPLMGRDLAAVHAINVAARPVLSVDLPSGMHGDTGAPMPECVHATLTATMVAPKVGFAAPGAAERLGRVEIVGIGGPPPAALG
jgi:NAD(P)H-hydrate epimerase